MDNIHYLESVRNVAMYILTAWRPIQTIGMQRSSDMEATISPMLARAGVPHAVLDLRRAWCQHCRPTNCAAERETTTYQEGGPKSKKISCLKRSLNEFRAY